ncbi:MAG TPA: hypothetical protein VF062_22410 [Candidatus Limnocylindrales bacterium]
MGTVPNGASRTLGALVRRGFAERVSLRVNGRRRVAFRAVVQADKERLVTVKARIAAEVDRIDRGEWAGDASHGSDANRFVPGAWPGCRCGYRPRDNYKLNQHFAEHGFREMDDHGQIVRIPVNGTA